PPGHDRSAGGYRSARTGRLQGRVAVARPQSADAGRGFRRRMKAALIWDDAFTRYRFRADHPFNPKRLELAISLIEAMGLLDGEGLQVVAPRIATDDELLRVHSPEYVAMVRQLSEDSRAWRDGLPSGQGTDDNPIFPGMHQAAATVVGGP